MTSYWFIWGRGGVFLIKRRQRTEIGSQRSEIGSRKGTEIGPVKDVLISPLEDAFRLETGSSGDVIVILGGGTKAEALNRLMCGHRLWKELHVPLIITGSGERTEVRSKKSDVGKGQMPDVRNQKGKSKGQKSEVGSLNKRDGWMKWRGTEVTSEKGLEK